MKGKRTLRWRRISAAFLAAALLVTSVQLPVSAQTATGPIGTSQTPFYELDFNQDNLKGYGMKNDPSYFTKAGEESGTDKATMGTAAMDEAYQLTDKNRYLDLRDNRWVSITKTDGTPLLAGKDNITIIYDSYHAGNDGTTWAFYADSDGANKNDESALKYFGILEAAGTVEKFNNQRVDKDASSMVLQLDDANKAKIQAMNTAKKWKRMAVVVDATTISLYMNGELLGTVENANAASLSSILGNDSVFWLGKANWNDGEYYNGLIDNFQVYDRALTAGQVAGTASADGVNLLADFDFKERNADYTYTDKTGNAKATPGTNVDQSKVWGTEGKALDFRGREQTLYVTQGDGSPILKGLESATIVFDSYLEADAGKHYWPFYAAKDVDAQKNAVDDRNYIGMCEIPGSTTEVSRYADTSTGKGDIILSTGGAATSSTPVTGTWKQVAVVLDKDNTYFYVDGQKVDEHGAVHGMTNLATMKEILGESGGIFQIGRANWGAGEFYNGMLDNFRIYNGALTADDVANVYSNVAVTSASCIADFNFNDRDNGFCYKEGDTIKAVARPFLIYDTDGDGSTELYLSEKNKTHLNLTQKNGTPLRNHDALTISYDSKPYKTEEGVNGSWSFYAAPNSNAQNFNKENYLGVRESTTHMDVQSWKNTTGTRLPYISKDTTDYQNQWRHIDLVIDGEKTTLYINGVEQDEIRSCHSLADIVTQSVDGGSASGIAQIGKANWGNGEYYDGYLDNFRIYKGAIHPQAATLTAEPAADAVMVESNGNPETDGHYIKVLAGHLQEELVVKADIGDKTVTLEPGQYEVKGYKSTLGAQEVTLSYNGATTKVKIYVYNEVVSKQKEVKDEEGNKLFTVNSTWYDYLSDPEREGKGNYDANSYIMYDADGNIVDDNNPADDGKKIVSSEAEFVQFNNAIDAYWRNNLTLPATDAGDPESNLKSQAYHPIYWGDFYSLDEAYRGYDSNPNNNSNLAHYAYEPKEGAQWTRYGQNYYGALWSAHSHQFAKSSTMGIVDKDLTSGMLSIGGKTTPYFDEVEGALAADDHGDVYMNIYRNVLMPFGTTEDSETGVKYYNFDSGNEHEETIQITDDVDNTVKWVSDNQCYDARRGTNDVGLDGVSFLPFNKNGDTKDIENCGFAAKMEFDFYTTYDGKLENVKNPSGGRVPIIFEFNGDDDFWLYIDGKLALDMGGSHGQCKGSINFAEQKATIESVRYNETYAEAVARKPFDLSRPGGNEANADHSVTTTFEDLGLDFSDPSVKHTAVIYYTERGKLEGNLRIKFNFPQENSLSVKTEVNTDKVNPAFKTGMDEIIAKARFQVDVGSNYTDLSSITMKPVHEETVSYNKGDGYTEGTILNGRLQLSSGQSAILSPRGSTDDKAAFLQTVGSAFTVKQTVDANKYKTSWVLYDTKGEVLGESTGDAGGEAYVDDDQSVYDKNTPGQFYFQNKDGDVSTVEDGESRTTLRAEYTNEVRTGTVSITKNVLGNPINKGGVEDIFYFRLVYSDLFGFGGGEQTYTGSYTLKHTDGTSEDAATDADGYIRLKAGETAVITGVPVQTKYSFQEDLDKTNVNYNTDEDKANNNFYQVVGPNEVSGEVEADVEQEAQIKNMKKNDTEFFAWQAHKTTLPIGDIQNLCDKDGNPLTNDKLDDDECKAEKTDNGIDFTGKILGNIVVYYKTNNSEEVSSAVVHVYTADNKAYVLDYGLPVDLNQTGDSSLGIQLLEGETDKYTISGVKPEYASVKAPREYKGVRQAYGQSFPSGKDYNWANYSMESAANGRSALTWTAGNMSLVYKSSKIMENRDVYDYRVDVKKDLATDLGNTAEEKPESGVRLKGTITVVPAEVVYYEDDFEAITVGGDHAVAGNRNKNLMQSNDQKEIYGYDEAYITNQKKTYDFNKNLLVAYDFSKVKKDATGAVANQTVIPDVSGNGNDATVVGSSATINGDVLTLPGAENGADKPYLEMSPDIARNKTAMTVSMWLKTERAAVENAAFYLGSGQTSYWMLNPYNDLTALRAFVKKDNAGGEKNLGHAVTDSSKWALYTMVMEDGKFTAYYNGASVGTNDNTGVNISDLLSDNPALYIGHSGYPADYYQGDVRDVRIYDKALTADEVKGLYDTDEMVSQATLDSAGSSTKLTATSGNQGKMTFTFTGTGLDVVGRTTADTAGVMVVLKEYKETKNEDGSIIAETGKVVKSKIVDTYYANGKLYQLPIISIKNLPYGSYHVTVKVLKTKVSTDETKTNDTVYIDGIRIYNPAGSGKANEKTEITGLYKKNEYQAEEAEIRELLLGGVTFGSKYLEDTQTEGSEGGTGDSPVLTTEESQVSLVSFDEDTGSIVYGQGQTQVENIEGSVNDKIQDLKDVLKCGPNNEVYLAKGSAIAFVATPITAVPKAERTIQIEMKKVSDDQKGAAEVTVPYVTKDNTLNKKVRTIETYTPMYREIMIDNCRAVPDGRMIILASTGDSMVSLTNVKVRGYTLRAINKNNISTEALEATYSLMRMVYMGESEKQPDIQEPDDGNTEDQQPDIQEPDKKPDDGNTDIQEPEKPVKELPFVDVPADSWYEPYVRYLYQKEVMTGLDERHFGAEETICRAQFAVILHRMAGSPKVEYQAVFKDVADKQFYTDAVMWASSKEQGIITGYTDDSRKGYFGPVDMITREQIATMLYRYAQYKGEDVKKNSDMTKFADSGQVSAFAEDAVAWAVGEGLIKGDNGKINPQGYANRAECAAMIQRFLER